MRQSLNRFDELLTSDDPVAWRTFELWLSSLFSFSFRPPLSSVFLAPDFQVSGVITVDNLASHFWQTMMINVECRQFGLGQVVFLSKDTWVQ